MIQVTVKMAHQAKTHLPVNLWKEDSLNINVDEQPKAVVMIIYTQDVNSFEIIVALCSSLSIESSVCNSDHNGVLFLEFVFLNYNRNYSVN